MTLCPFTGLLASLHLNGCPACVLPPTGPDFCFPPLDRISSFSVNETRRKFCTPQPCTKFSLQKKSTPRLFSLTPILPDFSPPCNEFLTSSMPFFSVLARMDSVSIDRFFSPCFCSTHVHLNSASFAHQIPPPPPDSLRQCEFTPFHVALVFPLLSSNRIVRIISPRFFFERLLPDLFHDLPGPHVRSFLIHPHPLNCSFLFYLSTSVFFVFSTQCQGFSPKPPNLTAFWKTELHAIPFIPRVVGTRNYCFFDEKNHSRMILFPNLVSSIGGVISVRTFFFFSFAFTFNVFFYDSRHLGGSNSPFKIFLFLKGLSLCLS